MALNLGKKFAELAGRKRQPQQQNTQPIFLPPSQTGINAIDGLANVPPSDALFLANMIPREFGVHVRKGYRQWCEPVPLGDGIKTLIAVEDTNSDTPTRRLFACTSDGIYDCSTFGGTPVKVYNFTIKDTRAGWCSWTHYTTTAGQFVLVADNSNGYIIYTVGTNSWAAGALQGPAPESSLDFVTVWKNRVWFVQGNTTKAWYLPVGQIGGQAKDFDFGNKFRYGGYLKSIWNWTLDGGEGVDDYLVALSSAGDMVVYKGTDPDTAADFRMHGWWYIGRPTQGRRNGDDMGGELLILTDYGVIQTSKMISGLPATDEQVSLSYKINPRINDTLQRGNTVFGWQMKFSPGDQFIIIPTPKEEGRPWMQFVYSLPTKAWCQFYGMPIKCCETWVGKLYFGDDVNTVWTYEGFADNVTLTDPGTEANAIEWELFQSFQNYGAPATFKRVQFLRPQFVGQATPTFGIAARYDFDISALPGSPAYVPPSGGLWDSGVWDVDVWGGGFIITQPPFGGAGMGRHIAITMRGRSAAETIHVGTDVLFDIGGML